MKGEKERDFGIFPSWGWLYGAVIIYGLALIVLLGVLSRLLDFGKGP